MQLQLERKANKSIASIEPAYLLQFLPLSLLSFLLLIKLKISNELKLFILSGLILTNLLILKSQEFNYQLATIPYTLAGIILYVNEQNRKLPTFFGFMLLYLFFIGILFQKGKKINFTTDDTITELVGVMHENRRFWENKTIFVAGSTDLSGFLLLDGQRVERINGVYKLPNPRWHERYDLVISLVNAVVPEDDQADAFWLRWPKVSSYQTRRQQFTLSMYKKPDLGSFGYSKQDSSHNAAEVRRIPARRISELTE